MRTRNNGNPQAAGYYLNLAGYGNRGQNPQQANPPAAQANPPVAPGNQLAIFGQLEEKGLRPFYVDNDYNGNQNTVPGYWDPTNNQWKYGANTIFRQHVDWANDLDDVRRGAGGTNRGPHIVSLGRYDNVNQGWDVVNPYIDQALHQDHRFKMRQMQRLFGINFISATQGNNYVGVMDHTNQGERSHLTAWLNRNNAPVVQHNGLQLPAEFFKHSLSRHPAIQFLKSYNNFMRSIRRYNKYLRSRQLPTDLYEEMYSTIPTKRIGKYLNRLNNVTEAELRRRNRNSTNRLTNTLNRDIYIKQNWLVA